MFRYTLCGGWSARGPLALPLNSQRFLWYLVNMDSTTVVHIVGKRRLWYLWRTGNEAETHTHGSLKSALASARFLRTLWPDWTLRVNGQS
jgi:hypothetical protein